MRISGSSRPGAALLLGWLTAAAPVAAQGGGAADGLKDFFARAVQEEGIVGAGMYLVSRQGAVDSAFAGYADLASRRKVDGATIFHWASITKTFTSIALMQLRDRGKLTLDDPVVRYIPELRAVHNPFGPMEAITLRQLASHSAGFRNGTWPWGGDKPWQPFEPTEWGQLVAMLPYTEILFPPGSRYAYSNPGVIFLGETIHRLTGDEYEVYAEKNLLRPLGMSASYFDVTPYHLLGQRSNNYYLKDGTPAANGLDFDTGITVSNGGLNAPLADMAKYLRFLLGGAPEPGASVLSRASLEEMWRPVIQAGGQGPNHTAIGIAFFLEERDGVRLIGHTGSQAGFRSFFYIHPESGRAIIAAFNTAPPSEGAGPEVKPRIGRVFAGLIERFVKSVRPPG